MKTYRMTGVWLLLMVCGSIQAFGQPQDLSVTVYNRNLALVRDVRTIQLKEGEQWLHLDHVAAQMDPASVHLRSLSHPEDFTVLEQYFEANQVSSQQIIHEYVGKEIELYTDGPDILKGVLLSAANDVVLQMPDGSVQIFRMNRVKAFHFPGLPAGMATKPVLASRVTCSRAGQHKIEINYLTRGLSWQAEYVGVLNQNEDHLDLSAWINLENHSGMAFKNCRFKLVAGDVNVGRSPSQPRAFAKAMAEQTQVQEKEFFEYHLYTVPGRSTIKENQTKQIALFSASNVTVEKKYLYDQSLSRGVLVKIRFQNSSKNGLGIPIPAGNFRVYKQDNDGSMVFLGEDRVDHTPRDEWLETTIGAAFDINVEKKKLSSASLGKQRFQEEYEIVVRNHKDRDISLDIQEHFYYRSPQSEWNIVESNVSYQRVDARTAVFRLNVPSGKQKTLRYIVHYKW